MKWPKELRKTKPRKCVLALLEKANRPLTAMEIHQELENQGEKVWLSTIYRILDLFEEYNLIVKNPITDEDVSLYIINKHEHEHFAKCIGCNKLFYMENCPLEEFNPKIEDKNFEIVDHRIEIFGYCNTCK